VRSELPKRFGLVVVSDLAAVSGNPIVEGENRLLMVAHYALDTVVDTALDDRAGVGAPIDEIADYPDGVELFREQEAMEFFELRRTTMNVP
jgi:hypothetical protein